MSDNRRTNANPFPDLIEMDAVLRADKEVTELGLHLICGPSDLVGDEGEPWTFVVRIKEALIAIDVAGGKISPHSRLGMPDNPAPVSEAQVNLSSGEEVEAKRLARAQAFLNGIRVEGEDRRKINSSGSKSVKGKTQNFTPLPNGRWRLIDDFQNYLEGPYSDMRNAFCRIDERVGVVKALISCTIREKDIDVEQLSGKQLSTNKKKALKLLAKRAIDASSAQLTMSELIVSSTETEQ